jgi:HlyD family secretion protein
MGFTVKVVVAFAAIFVLGFLGFQWYFTEDPATSVVYKTAPLQRGDLMASIGANGTLEPEDMVDVGAQIAGQILEFGKDANGDTIDYGSVVKKGMLLARIDEFPYKIKMLKASNQVEGAKAALKKAEADLSLAKAKHYLAETDWQRAQKMLASNTLAVAGYDSYKSAFETSKASLLVNEASVIQAKAELSEAENSLSSAKQDLSYCIIKSPVDGVVIDRRVNIGRRLCRVSTRRASS